MLPCVCSVIDYRWRKNVVRTKKWHTRRWPSVSLMLSFCRHFDVFCDLLPNRRTATWNLFVLYNKETNYRRQLFYFKIFQYKLNSKAGLCSLSQTRKKPFDVIYCLYKMKQFHWSLCVAKNCDWSRKITPLSNLT